MAGKLLGELAEACIERGWRVVLTSGRPDVDATRRWTAQFDGENWIEDRAGVSIRETISILQNAEGVVSVNTGVMHVGRGARGADSWPPRPDQRQTLGAGWSPCAIALEVPPPLGAISI